MVAVSGGFRARFRLIPIAWKPLRIQNARVARDGGREMEGGGGEVAQIKAGSIDAGEPNCWRFL